MRYSNAMMRRLTEGFWYELGKVSDEQWFGQTWDGLLIRVGVGVAAHRHLRTASLYDQSILSNDA